MIVLHFAGREESGGVAAGARRQDPGQAVHPHRAAGAGGALQEGTLAAKPPRPQPLQGMEHPLVIQLQCEKTDFCRTKLKGGPTGLANLPLCLQNSRNLGQPLSRALYSVRTIFKSSVLCDCMILSGRGPLRAITCQSASKTVFP